MAQQKHVCKSNRFCPAHAKLAPKSIKSRIFHDRLMHECQECTMYDFGVLLFKQLRDALEPKESRHTVWRAATLNIPTKLYPGMMRQIIHSTPTYNKMIGSGYGSNWRTYNSTATIARNVFDFNGTTKEFCIVASLPNVKDFDHEHEGLLVHDNDKGTTMYIDNDIESDAVRAQIIDIMSELKYDTNKFEAVYLKLNQEKGYENIYLSLCLSLFISIAIKIKSEGLSWINKQNILDLVNDFMLNLLK